MSQSVVTPSRRIASATESGEGCAAKQATVPPPASGPQTSRVAASKAGEAACSVVVARPEVGEAGAIDEPDDVAVRHLYPLRLAGGARGVDQVGEIAGLAGLGLGRFGPHRVSHLQGRDPDRQPAPQHGVGEDGRSARPGEDAGDPLGRVLRVERDVGGAGEQDPELGGDRAGRAGEEHADAVAPAHAAVVQGGGDPSPALHQVAVGEPLPAVEHGDRLRIAPRPRFDQAVDGRLAVVGARRSRSTPGSARVRPR